MTVRDLGTFFVLTFAVSWGVGILFVLFQEQVEAIFGPMRYTNPVFILMVYTPGIIGILMVWRRYGLKGLGSFFHRLGLWRMSWKWWLTLIVGMPAVLYAAAAIAGTLDKPFPYSPWYQVIPAALVALFIGPIEELGWRGVALPLLQRRYSPLVAALIVGVVAAVAHTRVPAQRHQAERLILCAVPPRSRRHLGDPHTDVQRRPRQPAGRRPLPLPDERPRLAGLPTVGHVFLMFRVTEVLARCRWRRAGIRTRSHCSRAPTFF